MKIIKLYGHLGKKFGKLHKYDVRTPAEAIRALCANFPDFKQHMLQHSSPGYNVISGTEDCVETYEKLHYPVTNTIKIIPIIAGAGGSWGNIILGAALIAVAWWNPMGWGVIANSAGGLLAGELAISAMTYVGTSLILTGVSQLLFSPPKISTAAEVEQNASAYFNGPQNVSVQGNPVPLIYGRLLVGSQIVSAELIASKYLVAPVAKTLGTEVWLTTTINYGKNSFVQTDTYKKNNKSTTITVPATDKFYTPSLKTNETTTLAYIRAGISGSDLDGKVVGFKIKVLPSTGILKIENADNSTTNIALNTQYATRAVDTQLAKEQVIGITDQILSPFNKNRETATGAVIRWYPPSGTWQGTVSFIYVMVDDDGVESAPLTVNMGYTG